MSTTIYGPTAVVVTCDATTVPHNETASCESPRPAPAAPRRSVPLAVAAAALALALSGCTASAVAQPVAPSPTPEPTRSVSAPVVKDVEPDPIRLAVIGDSITSWSPPFAGDNGQSWVFTATSNDIPLVGGWAFPGATIADMRANLAPADDVDVLVLMVGTNDVYQGTDITQRLADIDAMAATINADDVIVSSTAPFGYDYALGAAWNATLADHAAAQGWHYIDPWAGVRQPNGAWYPTTDFGDAVHPNPTTATYVGGVLRDAIVEVAR